MNVVQVWEGDGVNPKWLVYRHGSGCGAGQNTMSIRAKLAFLGDGYGAGVGSDLATGDGGVPHNTELLDVSGAGHEGNADGDGIGLFPSTDADPGGQPTW